MISRYALPTLIFVAVVLAISALFSMKGPLQDVHWDAPIYVSRAKEFAETPYLRRYMAEAPAIAEVCPDGRSAKTPPTGASYAWATRSCWVWSHR